MNIIKMLQENNHLAKILKMMKLSLKNEDKNKDFSKTKPDPEYEI